MKKLLIAAFVVISCVSGLYAQDEFESAFGNENNVSANFGVTTLGDQTLVGFRAQPTFSFGKIGLGLDIPLLIDIKSGDLRTEEFSRGAGVLRMVRFFSYGKKKKDNVYAKLGDMSGEELGYGALLSNYSNATSFERRKVGISADMLFAEKYGFEAIYSDLNFGKGQKLLAVRPYYKPLGETKIPVLKTLEIGASYISDKDGTSEAGAIPTTTFTRDGNKAFGFDAGLTFIRSSFAKLTADVQYATLLKNKALAAANPTAKYGTGSGFSTGLETNLKFVANVFHLGARIERQWYGDNYIPQFFNFAYEINKDARLTELISATSSKGIYGSLNSEILGKVKITGDLVLPDDLASSSRGAIVGLSLQTKEFANLKATGQYVKGQLSDLADAFKFDQRSLANILVTYRLNKFMVVGSDYRWTFAQQSDGSFKAVSQMRPYVGVSMKF